MPAHGWKQPAPLFLQRGQSSCVAGAMLFTADDITARDLGLCLVHVWLGPCEIVLLFKCTFGDPLIDEPAPLPRPTQSHHAPHAR
jgi:hypothetical protein